VVIGESRRGFLLEFDIVSRLFEIWWALTFRVL